MGRRCRSQKDFINAVREAPVVSYHPPNTFRAADHEITIPDKAIGRFLYRLSDAMTYDAYDRLTRAVWVGHFRDAPKSP